MRLILSSKGQISMVTSIDSGVILRRFFEHSHDCLSGLLEKKQSLTESLSRLNKNYKNPDKVTDLKRRLWRSENESQKQEEYFLKVKDLINSSAHILETFSDFKSQIEENIINFGEDNWLTPELQHTILPYLFSVRFLFNTEGQDGQECVVPEGLLEIHKDLYPDGFLPTAERLHIELNAQSSFISEHLSEVYKALVGIASTFTTIWALSIQAGLIIVSSPAVIPLIICVSLAFLGACAKVADMRHATKTNDKLALDKEILIKLIGNLNVMASFINALFSIKQDTQQLVAAAERTEKNMQVGVEAIQEIKTKIDNQQPAIVINNNLSEGAMKLLLEANARGELSSNNPLLLAFTGQTSATLQITGAPPSGANESEYLSLPRKRKISATSTLSAISEESLSASSSRSSTPNTDDNGPVTPTFPQESKFLSDSSSSYKGKGKATTPLMVEIESEEEYLAIQEFRKQRQIEMKANLDAA